MTQKLNSTVDKIPSMNLSPELMRLLKDIEATGAASLLLIYRGCNGSGRIDHVVCYDRDGRGFIPFRFQSCLRVRTQRLVGDLLDERIPEWRSKASMGEFQWQLRTPGLFHAHFTWS